MLTPKEISEKTFDKTFGFGYRMDDVDAYLDEVSKSMTELLGQKADFEKKLEVLADKLTEYREDEESLRTALLGAQKLGDSVIRESKTKAEIIMRDATIKAEAMVNNAKRQIEREQEGLARIQKEVASFKSRLLDLYKQHLELIGALPGPIERAAPPHPPEPVVPPEPETPPVTPVPEPPIPDPVVAPQPEPVFEPQPDQEPETAPSEEDGVVPPFFREEEPEDSDFPQEDEEEEQSVAASKFGELKFGSAFKIPRNDKGSKYK